MLVKLVTEIFDKPISKLDRSVMRVTIFLLSGFALSTTLSQTLMDVFETLLWLWAFYQLLWLQRFPTKSFLKTLISLSLTFIAVQSLGVIYSQFSLLEKTLAILEWRWIFSAFIIGYFVYSLPPEDLGRLRKILRVGLTLIVTTSVIKYYSIEWTIKRSDGWIGYMPLAHNLILWIGWMIFDYNMSAKKSSTRSSGSPHSEPSTFGKSLVQHDDWSLFKEHPLFGSGYPVT